jgi:ABC-type branched-subunit amino acid transport system substrate-binding protein
MTKTVSTFQGLTRRAALRSGAVIAGGAILTPYMAMPVFAEDKPPIGTWPDGSSGSSVFVAITVPRTGTYAAQGEDELKGVQLAIEHINNGHPLIKKISPKTSKGVLGKEVKFGVADSTAKPNTAVEEQTKFISDNKAVLMYGATSSAVAVALNHFAQQQHVLYVVGISGSNDTTGKDCTRYSIRQCFYGQTAAAGIGPVLIKAYGKGKKAAYLTPDYTYGHTVQKSMEDFLGKNGDWTTATNQVAPLGAPDYSNYLTNVANSGADVLININWGHDGVLSIQQAEQFGILPKMKLVIPYQIPFLSKEVGPKVMEGVYAATDFWWTLEDKFPLAKMFVDEFNKKYGYRPEWGANNGYMQLALWANAVEQAGTFYPPDVIKAYESGTTSDSTVGDVHFRAADHQLVRPVVIVRGKKPEDMKNPEDFWEVLDVLPGEPLMQSPDAFGCQLGSYT